MNITKSAGILMLVVAFSFSTQAQRKINRTSIKKLTVEQQVTLSIKKMILELDLTEMQQRKLTPILTRQVADRRAQREKLRNTRGKTNNIDANQKYELANQVLDKQIAFLKEMKSILNKEQFEKFKELRKKRLMGRKKRNLKNRIRRN